MPKYTAHQLTENITTLKQKIYTAITVREFSNDPDERIDAHLEAKQHYATASRYRNNIRKRLYEAQEFITMYHRAYKNCPESISKQASQNYSYYYYEILQLNQAKTILAAILESEPEHMNTPKVRAH